MDQRSLLEIHQRYGRIYCI